MQYATQAGLRFISLIILIQKENMSGEKHSIATA